MAPGAPQEKLRWLPETTLAPSEAGCWRHCLWRARRCLWRAPDCEPCFEVVCVPFSQVIPVGQGAVEAPGGSYLIDPDLFQYRDCDSGQTHQHTTSIGRMHALARSHPFVWTTTCICLRSVWDEREEDCKGRATSGPQSSFELSMSLVHTLKVFRVGLTTGRGPEIFALHWRTKGREGLGARLLARCSERLLRHHRARCAPLP